MNPKIEGQTIEPQWVEVCHLHPNHETRCGKRIPFVRVSSMEIAAWTPEGTQNQIVYYRRCKPVNHEEL